MKEQEPPVAPWEVLLIDNASIDGTAEIARACWQDGPAPLRIINESRLGVRYARERGFCEARYYCLAFIDDDNWVAQILALARSVVVLVAACEISPPAWFDNFRSSYAILTDRDLEQMEVPPEYLPAAGLCLNKPAWDRLIQNGFRF